VGILGVIFFLKMKSQKGLHVVELVQWHTTWYKCSCGYEKDCQGFTTRTWILCWSFHH
jgi:hypothetical protein